MYLCFYLVPTQVEMFRKNTLKLWEFAERKLDSPFRCRDIQVSYLDTTLSESEESYLDHPSVHGQANFFRTRQIEIKMNFEFCNHMYVHFWIYVQLPVLTTSLLWSIEKQDICWKESVAQVVMHESSLLRENLTALKEEAEVIFFVGQGCLEKMWMVWITPF